MTTNRTKCDRTGAYRFASVVKPDWARIAVAGIVALGLAGCESSNLLSSAPPETSVAAPQVAKTKTVAVYPVLAAPDPLNKQIQADVAGSIDRSRFQVLTVTDGSTPAADYQLRGYATASKDKSGAKFSYFFDVLDAQGQKLNRIAGEEPLKVAAKSKDLWPAVTPDIVKSIGTKTAASFAAGIASGTPVAGGSPAGGSASSGGAQPVKAVGQTPPQPATAAAPTADVPVAKAAVTGPLTVAVSPVSGAPGDGDTALTTALKAELKKKGLTVVESGPATYNVQGKVTTTPTEQGSESVKIAWDVKDAGGNRMATVSQGNTVEKGALSGTWGSTAGDIAAAASAAILPLLKKPDAAAAPGPGRQASAAGSVQ